MELRIRRFSSFIPIIFFTLLLSSCYSFRSVFWYPTSIYDGKHFPSDTIRNDIENFTVFHTGSLKTPLKVPDKLVFSEQSGSFKDFLKNSRTVAFLIIRNDTLVYSEYFKEFQESSELASFSVAKSFVSALTGVAIEEGAIKSIDQPVTDFFPELARSGFNKVTVGQLLTMRSGINFSERYKNPFKDASRLYYGRNLKKFILGRKVMLEPGKSYLYASGNTQLLAMVLEKATGKTISTLHEEKIWKPAGMAYPATWSLDSKKNHEVKAFCCIHARAIDFARFGQLYLDSGQRAGKSIIPSAWVRESLTIQNDSRDSRGYPYTYGWRVNENGEFFAYGVLGQYIFCSPEKKIVIVRIGEKAGSVDWPKFFHLLVQQL